MAKKATNSEIEVRVATIAEMIIKGQSKRDIIDYSSENWNIGRRQTENYIRDAYSKIKVQTGDLIENQAHIALGRLNDLYKRSYQIQDYRECRQVQGDIISLLDLKGNFTIKKEDKDGNDIQITKLKKASGYSRK